MEDVERAHVIGLIVGGVLLFVLTFVVIALARRLYRATHFRVLSVVVAIVGFGLSYLAYGHVASAVEESLVLRFVETGFICILPGVLARVIVPALTAGAAGVVHLVQVRRAVA